MPEGQSSRTHTAPGEGESVWLVEDLIEVKLSAEDTGGAWQRCRTHYAADLMSTTPKSSWAWVRHCCTPSTTRPTPHRFTPCSTASPTPSQRSCPAWRGTSRTPVRPSSPSPRSPRRSGDRSRSTNPNGRLNKEIRRRTDVVGIFPDRNAIIGLVGVVLAEQHDEWAEGRRYLGLDVLARAQDLGTTTEEVTAEQTLQAIAA
jgi:putative transposase